MDFGWTSRFQYARIGKEANYPYVRVESMVQALERRGKLYKLLGFGRELNTLEKCGDNLELFWSQFRKLHGSHEVFALSDSGQVQLRIAFRATCTVMKASHTKKTGAWF